jgi:hypothetical protein
MPVRDGETGVKAFFGNFIPSKANTPRPPTKPPAPPTPSPKAMTSITGESFPDVLKGNTKYQKVIMS